MRRPGFVASPRVVVPALLLIVVLVALASLADGGIPSEKVGATVTAGGAIILLFGLIIVLTRFFRGKGQPK